MNTSTIASTLASLQAAEQHLAGQVHAAADLVASVGTVSLPDALERFNAECALAVQRLEQARRTITAGLAGVLARMATLADDLTLPETPTLPMTPALEETPTAPTPAVATVEEKQKQPTQTDDQPELPGVDPEPAVMATVRTPSAEPQAGQCVAEDVEPIEAVAVAANDAIGTKAPSTLATASEPKEVPTPDGGGRTPGKARGRRGRR